MKAIVMPLLAALCCSLTSALNFSIGHVALGVLWALSAVMWLAVVAIRGAS